MLPSTASTLLQRLVSLPLLSSWYNQTSVSLIFVASMATVWFVLGLSIVKLPLSKTPCLKCTKYPELELPAPLPSSLYKNAKLFPGRGSSS